MEILVVEGNPERLSAPLRALGGVPYGESYARCLEKLSPRISCSIVHPCEDGLDCLARGRALSDYAGIVITGSGLSCCDENSDVLNQVRFAEKAFVSERPVFGSCWGLQVMARALGGKVRRNPKGREFSIGYDIVLTEAGRAHPMYTGIESPFAALAVHADEVESLPAGWTVLAGNGMSAVQAAAIQQGNSTFWGVQYHPEFSWSDMAVTARQLAPQLIKEGFYTDEASLLERTRKMAGLDDCPQIVSDDLSIPHSLLNPVNRQRELANWVHTILI